LVTVLVPAETAERCYLSEALLYVALGRVPLSFLTEYGIDARADYEYHRDEEIKPFLPSGNDLTETECKAAGLKPSPGWATPETDPNEHFVRDELFEERRERQEKWDAKLQDFFDNHRLKLFASLHEDRVRTFGKKLPGKSTISDVKDFEFGWWQSTPWEPIPPRFWISAKKDWENCHATGRGVTYVLILVDTDDLIEEFPLPSSRTAKNIAQIGDNFMLLDDTKLSASASRLLGRPSLPWDEFFLEIARHLHSGTLPPKQEAFISEMQEWCKRQWEREVARSTLLQKIKPYYDAFVRSKGSEKDG
jgi:hypothetical protein